MCDGCIDQRSVTRQLFPCNWIQMPITTTKALRILRREFGELRLQSIAFDKKVIEPCRKRQAYLSFIHHMD